MAISNSKNIKGLTVEIGADTQPLSKAIKESESAASAATGELRKVNAALKFDPSNVTLLTQKQKLLADQVDETKKSLALLQQGEEAAHKAVANKEAGSEEALREIQREIVIATAKLGKLEEQAQETETALKNGGESGAKAQKDVKNAAEKTGKSIEDVGDAADDSSGKMSTFGEVLRGSLAADLISSACRTIVSGIKGIGQAAVAQLDTMGELDDNAQKIGMSAESLQEWQYAAKLGGMESETLVRSLEKQQKSFADAKTGSTALAESYAALGINVEAVGSSEEALNAVIDALADCEDETTRNAVANDIFGKSYAELAPLLNLGSKGIAELRQEARDLGLVLSDETVAASAEAGDSFDKLTGMIDTTKSRILSGFLPSLSRVADGLREKLNTRAAQKQLTKLGESAGKIAESAADLSLKLLPKLADAMEFASKHGSELVKIGGSAIVMLKGFKIASTATNLLGGMRTAFASLNATIAANPVGLFITVLGALVTALNVLDLATESSLEKQQALAESYRDAADAAAEAAEIRANAGADMQAEMQHYDDLIAELDELVDADGRVKQGYEARVAYILGELSEASGEEIEIVDGVIQKYNELTGSIKDSITMRQAEDYLSTGRSDYDAARAAIDSLETDEDGNYAAGSLAAVEAARENLEYYIAQAQKEQLLLEQIAAVSEMISNRENLAVNQVKYDELSAKLDGMLRDRGYESYIPAVQAMQDAYDAAVYVYDQNTAIVSQYEAVQSGVWAQDAKATGDALEKAAGAMMDARSAAMTSLERQRTDALVTYNKFKSWAAQSNSAVTAAQVQAKGEKALAAAQAVFEKMIAESDRYTQDEIEAAGAQVSGLMSEVRGMSMREIADYLDDVRQEAGKTGDAMADGIVTSVQSNAPRVTGAVRDLLGAGSIDALRRSWEIASPSKASARAAGYFTAGVQQQFVRDSAPTLATVRRYADSIRDTFDGGMTLSEIEIAAQEAKFGRSSRGTAYYGSVDLDAICARLDRISARLSEMDTTMVLDDGTLIARTDRVLGETAAQRERGGLIHD